MKIRPPKPPLSDGVVTLRPWREGDVGAIVAACNDPAIAEFLDQIPSPYTEDDAREYVAGSREGWADGTITNFAITENGSGRPVGSVGVRWLEPEQGVVEVGYWVSPEARGRGLCTRAVSLVSRWLIVDHGVERVQLRADEENVASRRVAEKAGFTQEGVLRSSRYNPRLGRRINFVMYSLLRGELPP
ncbi:MAG TPA: GNAT family N-acetyltransferase [Gaiellaceae bacterium]|nr:GNAT family N-acetyltransferase [Gaiellaceae bacterium]